MQYQQAVKRARQLLIKQSKQAQAIQHQHLIHTGETVSINDILLEQHYANTEAKVLLRYDEWKRAGFQVKRNAKAVRIWGAKRQIKCAGEQGSPTEYAFYPMCCLFSEKQVIPLSDEACLSHVIRTYGPETSNRVASA